MSAPIRLGPFILEKPVATGGMAEVWIGVHETQKLPVAVKVITGAFAKDPAFVSAFRNEVRAVAGLHHPGVVLVFDYGTIPKETAKASGGRLQAGSVYLVMEYASGGCLTSISYRTLLWTEVRDLLLALLHALGHAHARDVIHRDIKPGNVLLCGPDDLRPGIKLSDFGIAYPVGELEHAQGVEMTSGTPGYMAPEQIEGRWREFGPWTDLYALGCLAYELTTWVRPYEGSSPVALATAHLLGEAAPFISRLRTPVGFEGWLKRLMASEPTRRFQCAAEASWSLLDLEYPEDKGGISTAYDTARFSLGDILAGASGLILTPRRGNPTTEEEALSFRTTDVDGDTVTHWAQTVIAADSKLVPQPRKGRVRSRTALSMISRPVRERTPMAEEVEEAIDSGLELSILGAGLGLYGLRRIPLVGRREERDVLWRALRRVREKGELEAIFLEGPTGTGKSRLAMWITETALELGLATVLKVSHGPERRPLEGLAQIVKQTYRCGGESRSKTASRIRRRVHTEGVEGEYEWSAMTELVLPATDEERAGDETTVQFASPLERYALIQRLLERQTAEVPCILWIEDAQWGEDILNFLTAIFDRRKEKELPVLVVATVRNDAVGEHRDAATALGELRSRKDTLAIEFLNVGALSDGDHRRLIEELLHLEGDLAEQVRIRTHGNPMFAVQLIEDWVQRGILEVQPTGFALKENAHADIPDNIHQVWMDRVERVLEGPDPTSRHALEIGSALGHIVLDREWRAACLQGEVPVPKDLIDRVLSAGLIVKTEEGFGFAHVMLQESLHRSAQEGGRWSVHNLACADMLQNLYPSRRKGIAERLGRHLYAGGGYDNCLFPLLEGAQEQADGGNYEVSLGLLSAREHALEESQASDEDPRWLPGWLLRSCVHLERGDLDDAEEWAVRARELAQETKSPKGTSDALGWLAHCAYQRGRLGEADAYYREGKELSMSVSYSHGVGNSLSGLASVLLAKREFDAAHDHYQMAFEHYESIDAWKGMARSLYGRAVCALHLGEYSEADVLNRRSKKIFDAYGCMDGVALCLNGLAESARFQDDLINAESGYRRAIQMFETLGSGNTVVMRLNLGLVLLGRGQYVAADAELRPALRILETQQRSVFFAYVHAELLACKAARGEWEMWEEHLEGCSQAITDTEAADRDIAWPVELAGRLASAAGRTAEAAAAFRLALLQWEAIGQDAEAEAVRLALSKIDC